MQSLLMYGKRVIRAVLRNIGSVAIACLNNISPVSSTVLVYACSVVIAILFNGSGIDRRIARKAILGNGGIIVLAILRDTRCIIIAGLRNGRCVRIPRCLCPLGDGCLVIVSQILRHRGGAVGVACVVGIVLADVR